MALIFDTETSGLPECAYYSHFPDYSDLTKYSNARVVQVSYILTNSKFDFISESDTIIKVDFPIDNHCFHGITNEISDSKGILFLEFADKFKKDLEECDVLIAHNINFDISVLKSEFYRYSLFDIIDSINTKKIICTMRYSKNLVRAKFKNSDSIKDPNLKELYYYATGKIMKNHHNSLYDTRNLHEIISILHFNGLLLNNVI